MTPKLASSAAIGAVVALATLVWSVLPRNTPRGPTPTVTLSSGVAAQSRPAPTILAKRPALRRRVVPTVDTLAHVHKKLQTWLYARANGVEEEQSELLEELNAMLSDANAMDLLQSLSNEEQQTPFGLAALGHWATVDPANASDWVAANPKETQDQTWVVAHVWAEDSAGFRDYIGRLPDSAWKRDLLREEVARTVTDEPSEARALAEQLTGPDRASSLQAVAGEWIQRDHDAALAWIAGETDAMLREQLVASAAESYALTDPNQAASWLVASVGAGAVLNDASLNIVTSWASSDPAQAAEWVARFPGGPTRAQAVQIIADQWQQSNPSAVAQWLQGLPERAAYHWGG